MNTRLNKVSIAFIAGIVAFSVPSQADAVGNLKKANEIKRERVDQISVQPNENLQVRRVRVDHVKLKPKAVKVVTITKKEKIAKQKKEFLKVLQKKDITKIDLNVPSGLTSDEIENILKDTGLKGLGYAFEKAEKNYGVNAYYLIAHAAWESGWGTSKLSKNKNNLFGFSAYDKSAYSSAKKFKSKADCIDTVASFISQHYLKEDGDHYNGSTLVGMNKKYASDKNWATGIALVMKGLADKNKIIHTL